MEINTILTKIEKGFNTAAGIPIVALISSVLRVLASKIQILIGIILGLIGLLGQMIHNNNSAKWENLSHKGLEQAIHGGLNFVRGLNFGISF